ncbi:MAG: hypothetical protein JWM88_49 [Verrucomicrobia bacterium]|nr:hypothetical protein [Verrucomicrobiota bacterium]
MRLDGDDRPATLAAVFTSRRDLNFGPPFQRLLAVGGIALVLLLTALTASPELHRFVHGHDDVGADDGCAVVQFAHGVSAVPDVVAAEAGPAAADLVAQPRSREIFLASSRYLHPPERGPPAS